MTNLAKIQTELYIKKPKKQKSEYELTFWDKIETFIGILVVSGILIFWVDLSLRGY